MQTIRPECLSLSMSGMRKLFITLSGLCVAVLCAGQADTLSSAERHVLVNLQQWTRGEVRDGALPAENGADNAMFLMGNTVLRLDYTSPGLDVRFSPKHFGVWGASANGALAVDEAWLTLKSRGGLFARVGRQKLSYDDQRIIGNDDWVMAPLTHDAVKAGFEGKKHKLHLLLAFNQNNENINGGTYYKDGGQDYKAMQALWYHYEPTSWLGASLIGLNMGMQSLATKENETCWQQIFGAFLDIHPGKFSLQASYYRQTGHDEYNMPIHAWMASAESSWKVLPQLKLLCGYFHMSGDPYYFVPAEGAIGMARKTEIRGFNPIFGSHHKFYGAMDFFYVTTYYGGNTPGLQDFHFGVQGDPFKKLSLQGTYHHLATSVEVENAGKTLGHELEFSLTWKIAPDVNLMAGYSYMDGTDTMIRLKRTSDQNSLHWGWLMLTVSPELFRR